MTGDPESEDWPEALRLDSEPGPAPHLPRAKADALIDGALDAAYGPPGAQATAPSHSDSRSRPLWVSAAAILLALLGVGGASAAVMWWRANPEPAPAVQSQPPRPPRAKAPAPVDSPPEDPAVIPTPPPEEAEPAPERKARRASPRPAAPDDLLESANQLRAARRWRAADRAYAQVWQRFPRSRAAYVARVASASLHLEHLADPRGALRRYRAALASSPTGPLSPEIRWGIARAQRRRGDTRAEGKALETFLQHHPESPRSGQAQARLREL